MERIRRFAETVSGSVGEVIVGRAHTVQLLVVALLCEGHVLLEDVPGVGKTMLARALAGSLGVTFKRVQCTPDLLPSDIAGVSVFDQRTGDFEFRPGPIFTNVLLADEINRATPRTQSALLEAMGERQVSADAVTYPLEPPFLVLATENPVEFEGTFPLPEAQLDRFLFRLSVGYPTLEEEVQVLRRLQGRHPIELVRPVVDGRELPELAQLVTTVHVDNTVAEYIVRLVQATRSQADLSLGVSPRGSLALFKGAQAWAAVQGRDYILPDDVKALAGPALEHRLMVKPESALRGRTAAAVLAQVLEATPLRLE